MADAVLLPPPSTAPDAGNAPPPAGPGEPIAATPPVETPWRRLLAALRPPRRLRFTREGKFFVGMTFAVGFAAINTGNNLLYIILGMMLSLILVSGILSELTLRGVHVARRVPPQIFAGRPFLMGIALQNTKRRLPSFSLEVEDLLGDRPLDKKCYFLKVPAGKTQATSYRFTFARRGVYGFHGFTLATKYPFALFRKSRDIAAPAEVIVFPRVSEVGHLTADQMAAGEGLRSHERARGDEFHGLREFRSGDDPRDIHWKVTAKLGRTMVREYEGEAVRRVVVGLDNRLPGGDDADTAGPELLDEMETAVELTASLARHFLERGYAVGIAARGGGVDPGAGPAQLWRLLRFLAVLRFLSAEDRVPPPVPEPDAYSVLVLHRRAGLAGVGRFARVFQVGQAGGPPPAPPLPAPSAADAPEAAPADPPPAPPAPAAPPGAA
jgi:uncharacterized protein (DUF58 family)